MIRKPLLLLLLNLAFFATTSFSQTTTTDRVEFDLDDARDGYTLIPADTNGLLVFYEKDEKANDGKRHWVFTLYDQQMQEVSTKMKLIDKSASDYKYYFDKTSNILYVILMSRNSKMQYTLLTYDFTLGRIATVTNELPVNFTVTGFVVNNDAAYLGGYKLKSKTQACMLSCLYTMACGIPYLLGANPSKFEPIVARINKETGDFKMVNLNYPKSSTMMSMTLNEYTGKAEAVIFNNPERRQYDLYLRVLGEKDKSMREIYINPNSAYTLNSASSTNISKNERLIVGMYSDPTKKGRSGSLVMSNIPKGFYVTRYNADKQDFIRYYPFKKFDYFKELMEKSSSKNKKKKREPYTGFLFSFHAVLKIDSNFIVVADAYEPVYETRMTYDAASKTWKTERVLVGYTFTKSMAASFDVDGNMNWNSVFTIWSPTTWNLSPKTKIAKTESGTYAILYTNGAFIKSKLITIDGLTEGQHSSKLATDHKSDKVVGYSGDVEYWYGDYFIAYGYQRIVNKKKEAEKKRRTVFYMNKVEINY